MTETAHRAIAIVGVGAVLPDAPNVPAFWDNLSTGRYSISETPKERWDPDHYYDPDPQAPDKSYTKIGGWVKEWAWNPLQWRLPIPPTVSDQMDRGQQWSVVATREALIDYGWPDRPLDQDRTAVILGNAMGGDKHYLTALRIFFPEYAEELAHAPHFEALPKTTQQAILGELQEGMRRRIPDITEDTMPGELANIIAGRVANLFNFHGPNYIVDAACASAMAAITAAVEGLEEGDYDAVITGGVDANMSASSFVKFCKIGALSATGTRPYADGADGFVMGEGASIFLLKRLADAERDGDTIYAILRGLGGSSDGKGKGITAPNPIGQRLAMERGWQNAGLDPATVSMIEGHGTSTRVGDVIEANSIVEVFGAAGAKPHSIPLGSVKSNIGHLKAGAGSAGLLKATLALHHKTLPPSLNFTQPNPNIDFDTAPFYVNTECKPWDEVHGEVRRAGVSAFGFGGTNFHTVLEEYVPGRLQTNGRTTVGFAGATPSTSTVDVAASGASKPTASAPKTPLRGALVIGGASNEAIQARLEHVQTDAEAGVAPPAAPPAEADLRAPVRLAIDYGDAAELADKAGKALKALEANHPGMWKALRAQGIFRGEGAPGKVAFLYTGQGSQYVNMLKHLRAVEPIVAETFAEADAVMMPILGKPLSEYIFIDADDPEAVAQLEEDLKQTEITQPAVLAADEALTRLLAAYGITPDLVMGHSLGEYGALVAAGALSFADALKAVSARGHAMKEVSVDDNGLMAAVFAPLSEVERILAQVDDYVVPANINSITQAVIGGSTTGVQKAMHVLTEAGFQVAPLPVSHAFHTRIVAPASEPLRGVLHNLDVRPPSLPIVANVSGTFYPMRPGVEDEMVDILAQQVASPVQFVEGLETLYAAGARVFVETGPKKALFGFADDVLGDRDGVLPLFANHPKIGDLSSFNQALCGLYAAGLGIGEPESRRIGEPESEIPQPSTPLPTPAPSDASTPRLPDSQTYLELGKLFADFLDRGRRIYEGRGASEPAGVTEPVVITGAALGLPGTDRVFDDANIARLLHGEPFIDVIPSRVRRQMVAKHVTRLVKNHTGEPHFETIENTGEVIKLAGRAGALDLVEEFGFPEERIDALESTTRMAIGAGLDALRDAGIPLAMRYKTTTTGSRLPERWLLPDGLRDDTGVIFASAFPGFDAFAEEMERFYADTTLRQRLDDLKSLRARLDGTNGHDTLVREIDRRIHDLETKLADAAYVLDRKFLFRILSMGHSQFAEYVGARGPNTQINAACASTTQAVGLAEDWIRQGRCRRVIVVAADNVTSDHLLAWIGAGFLATGAAATDEVVEEAALPFDKRRHGMIVGAGAAALVVESAEAACERGIRPITEVLSTVTANSAFHGTRLDVDHIAQMTEDLVRQAEQRWGISRHAIAPQTVFVSHETYTPARGGSAQAEVDALRHVFGAAADQIVIANTKGFTGHAMGAGVEDVLAVKALETGLVPPVANFKEVDPDLGRLNLSQGGAYPVRYALRLGAGFGSQISLSLIRWVPTPDGTRPAADQLGFGYRLADRPAWSAWLRRLSGYEAPEVEVVQRTLRIKDQGPPPFDGTAEPKRTVRPAALPPQPTAPASVPTAPAPPLASEPPVAPAPEPALVEAGPDPVEQKVLDLVAEQTGYPKDMLDLDLDLEADLGIDTVKQAEMFAAIREAWGIERDEHLQLRNFPTLKHVIGFVYDKRPDLKQAPPAPAAQPAAEPVLVPTTPDELDDPVKDKVLDLVAEQTGYPKDMLDLDLDLEADLGIDTVKQAEMFANVRAAYDIPRDDNLQLRDFPTLADVIQFVYDRAPSLMAGTTPSGDGIAAPAEIAEIVPHLEGDMEAAAGVPRRVPVPLVRPALDLFKETRVTLDENSRVLVMLDRGGVGQALVRRLAKRGVEVLAVDDAPDAETLTERIESWLNDGPIHGVYWLPALDEEQPFFEMAPEAWHEAIRVRVKLLYATMRALYDDVEFLVAATRLGGFHGYDEAGAVAPLGGAVAGFAKTFKRERAGGLVKAVDFAPSRKTASLADLLIDETLRDPGVVEVGYGVDESARYAIGLGEQPLTGEEDGMHLNADTVFVVTGAAGSIVSAITADLARHAGGTFYLLDLVPKPDPNDADLARFATDKDGIKRDIFERLKADGERATPALVEKELAKLERLQAAQAAIQAVEQAGGTAHYYSVDLLEGDAVAAVIDDVREQAGRIDVLLHAAGLEVSRMLPNKEPEEFDLVFDVKADGWYHLLHAAGEMPLGATVVFSSIAGRFGNAGQADYSAANDLLCKTTSSFRTTWPATRGLAIDWTAWGEIGMASRGSIPTMMAHAGINMLPPEAGIPIIRRELTQGAGRGEVVVAKGLGVLLEPWDPTGGLALDAVDLPGGPMTHTVKAFDLYDGLTVEAELDPSAQPFLDDHRIDGTPVLPGVMGLEAFAEAARLLFPDRHVDALEDVRFLAPFKFYRDEPRTVTVHATFHRKGDDVIAACRLVGQRELSKGIETTTHFTATVRLTTEPPETPADQALPAIESEAVERDAIYQIYFHGPAYQVVERVGRVGAQVVGQMPATLPANHGPETLPLAIEPRLVELCFQTAGVAELGTTGQMGLPARIARVATPRRADEASGPLYAVVTPNGDAFDAVVVDDAGAVYVVLDGYGTSPLPGSVAGEALGPLHAVMH